MSRLILYIVLFFSFPQMRAECKTTICLNMIVKNEKSVIERCLTSVLPLIDYWVIVDTGSADGTQQVIKDFMQRHGVPGELHERPWVDFSHNRNEALSFAKKKGDYVFFIDADEYLVYEPDFKLPTLDKDYYYMTISHSGSKYCRNLLINNRLDWKWVGVLHEVLTSSEARTYATLAKVVNIYTTEGARSKDPKKYQRDAEILEAALEKEPHNSRYIFYLAQSYCDSGNYSLALKNYEKRAAMGGANDQEVFWSLLRIGEMNEALKKPKEDIIRSYQKAFEYRSSRAEPLYHLARYFRSLEDFDSAYRIGKIAQTIPLSQDILFVQEWMYLYGISLELSISAYWIGKYDECQEISIHLLKRGDLPDNIRICVENNLGFANAKLLQQVCPQEENSALKRAE